LFSAENDVMKTLKAQREQAEEEHVFGPTLLFLA